MLVLSALCHGNIYSNFLKISTSVHLEAKRSCCTAFIDFSVAAIEAIRIALTQKEKQQLLQNNSVLYMTM